MTAVLEKTMLAAHITAPHKASVHDVAVPSIKANQVLIEIKNAGICGTDLHIWHGGYALANYPVIPGHELSGVIAQVGDEVQGFKPGDRVTIDPNLPCHSCFFCHRRQFTRHHQHAGVTAERNHGPPWVGETSIGGDYRFSDTQYRHTASRV